MKGTDAFHPGVSLNFGDESCEKVADLLAYNGCHRQVASHNKLHRVLSVAKGGGH